MQGPWEEGGRNISGTRLRRGLRKGIKGGCKGRQLLGKRVREGCQRRRREAGRNSEEQVKVIPRTLHQMTSQPNTNFWPSPSNMLTTCCLKSHLTLTSAILSEEGP